MPVALNPAPAARGLTPLARPRKTADKPRHSYKYQNGRDATCTSGRSGTEYGVTDRPGFSPCQCYRAERNQGCSHSEQFAVCQRIFAHYREQWPNLRPLSARPYFERCPWPLCSGKRVRVSFFIGVGAIRMTKLHCLSCGKAVSE